MTQLLWSATPGVGDVDGDWATFINANFGGVANIETGLIKNAPDALPALEANFPIGGHYGFNDVCEPLVSFPAELRTSVTLKYDVYLDPNIDYLAVTTLGPSTTRAFLTFPGLVGGQLWPGPEGFAYPVNNEPVVGDNWSARLRISNIGKIGVYAYVQNKPTSFGWMRVSNHPLRINDLRGRVTTWEQTCVMNTPGFPNGRAILKIDGETIVSVLDLEYRSEGFDNVVTNGLRLAAFVQGVDEAAATANFQYWTRNYSITSNDLLPGSYSISARAAPERKTDYDESNLPPTVGEGIELRVDERLLHDKAGFWNLTNRMLQRMRERGEPRF